MSTPTTAFEERCSASNDRTPHDGESVFSRVVSHPASVPLILVIAAAMLLVLGIGKPAMMYYDEGYFVPEARAFLQGIPNPHPVVPSLVRPPLGKLVIAVGMKVAGDDPFGWRIAGATCGALTVAAVYLWTNLLLDDRRLAFVAAGLTLFDNFLFVMSRIGMMDIFLIFFLTWSLVAYTSSLELDVRANARRALFICSGVLAGLAGACKWNAIDTLAVYFVISFALLLLARRAPKDIDSRLRRYAKSVREIGLPTLLFGLIVAPIAAYAITYWPVCRLLHRPFGIQSLIEMNGVIWHFSTTEVSNRFIVSPWYRWPLNLSPQRALSYLVGNPVVTWGGLVALFVCLGRLWKRVAFPEGFVLLLFASNFLQWVVTPEKGLFYYYYFPCVVILGVAIAVALKAMPPKVLGVRLGFLLLVFSVVIFLWCYPQMAHLQAPWDCALGCWS
jgi:dolichyl-phosphate-mannose-protein mannosyltransferase